MTHQFFLDKRPHNGNSLSEYMELMRNIAERPDNPNFSGQEKEDHALIKLNYQRFSRILRTYKVDKELSEMVQQISAPQIWMIISEISCGDSAQNIPYIARISEINPLIQSRIIMRDTNTDIMDLYLTDGKSRSIPKLIVFNEEGDEIFQWGPRPVSAQELVNNLRNEGMHKEIFLEQLHLWYGRDRGKSLEAEFKNLLQLEPKQLIINGY